MFLSSHATLPCLLKPNTRLLHWFSCSLLSPLLLPSSSSMEAKMRICEICNKRFANGKAMGGHMRSHSAKLPVASKPTNVNNTRTPTHNYFNTSTTPPPPWPSKPAPSSSSSLVSSRCITKTQVHYFPHHRSFDSHEPIAFPKSSSLDRDSETDSSPRNPTRKRSKRSRRLESPPPQQPWGLSDAEVAMCLLMLSMDRWTESEIKIMKPAGRGDKLDLDEDNNDDEEEEVLAGGGRGKSKREKKYKCETCNKKFQSYQALGGHRASHKNKKLKICFRAGTVEEEEEEEDEDESHRNGLVGGFECPYCDKVFESGQALDGHRKVHFSSYLGLGMVNPIASIQDNYLNSSDNLLDLNLPAEAEEEGDEEEVSTVSNAEFRSRLS